MTKTGDIKISGDLTVAGDATFRGVIKASDSVRGIDIPVEQGTSETIIEFPEIKTGPYAVTVTPHWNSAVWVSAKQPDGFLIEFSSPAPDGAALDWIVLE